MNSKKNKKNKTNKPKKIVTGRDLARQVLLRVQRDRAYANLVLSAALRRAKHLRPEEKNLATELTYGVLRYQRLLDHALSQHARQPLEQVNSEVLDAMRLAAYQILMLDRIPAFAAVDDAVEAIRTGRGASIAGFANAVLRKLSPQDLERDLPAEPVSRLAVSCSLPDTLASYWHDQLGLPEAERLARQLLERTPLTIRCNPRESGVTGVIQELEGEGAHVERCGQAPEGLRLRGLTDPFRSKSYLSGRWTVQDEAAQLVAHLVDPRPDEVVLDACCGVGGKSTHLAALMANRGQVLCVDISQRKLELLKEHALRLGVDSCRVIRGDLRGTDGLALPLVDRALLDAPCSGLGVLGRHPELKWRLDLSRIEQLVALQRELLSHTLRYLKPGGTLVYSVCTTTEEEGPEQVQWLLGQYDALELIPCREAPFEELGKEGVIRTWPHRHQMDGFFMARFRLQS